MYIQFVQGNVKRGVDVELGYRTLIVGPNGSGKSSIINAIELGLCGYATDISGRPMVKRNTDLIALANEDSGLKVTLETDTNHRVTYSIRRDGDRVKRATHRLNGLHATMPFMDVREHLTGSAAKAKTYLLGWMSHTLLEKDIYDKIPAENLDEYQAAAKACKTQAEDPIDLLVKVIAYAKQRVRESRKEAKTLTEVVEGSGLHMNTKPTTEQEIASALAEEQRLFQVYTRACQDVSQSEITPEARDKIMAKWQALSVELPQLQDELNRIEMDALFSPVSDRDHRLFEVREKIREIAEMHHAMGATACSVCASSVNPPIFVSTAQNMEHANQQMEYKVNLHRKYDALKTEFSTKKQEGRAMMEQVAKIERLLKNPPKEVDVAALEAEYKAAMAKRQALEQQLKAWSDVKRLHLRVQSAEKAVERHLDLAEQGERIIGELLQQAIDDFQDEVNKFIPDDFILDIDLENDSCTFGLRKDTKVVTALSGAEWAKMLLAIGCAMSQGADFRVFTPEERAYDENTLSAMMEALTDAPGQVLLTTTTEPSFIPPEWTVVRLTDQLPF